MRPFLLLTNDDGVQAKGLNNLIDMLSPIGDLLVMAPDGARSGGSCSFTAKDPVRYRLLSVKPGIRIFACSGTPVDCVKLALATEASRKPDLIISGINHGDNSSVCIHYSGTMGAVLEGCMKGIPSVGFSLRNPDPDADFLPIKNYICQITQRILQHPLTPGICLNVNFPKPTSETYAGLRVCRMSKGRWDNEWYEANHPKGMKYYWLTGSFTNLEPDSTDTDSWALDHNFVSITPITLDMTAYEIIQKLKFLED